jgi:hypothetical protein
MACTWGIGYERERDKPTQNGFGNSERGKKSGDRQTTHVGSENWEAVEGEE